METTVFTEGKKEKFYQFYHYKPILRFSEIKAVNGDKTGFRFQ